MQIIGGTSWEEGPLTLKFQWRNMNPFEATVVLGLDPFSGCAGGDVVFSPREIEKAYRRQARKHHPDKNGGGVSSSSGFQRLQTAKDVLLRRHEATPSTVAEAGAFATAALNPNSKCRIVAQPPRRTCIRQVLVYHWCDAAVTEAATTIVAASDDGLMILQDRPDGGDQTFLENHLFLCCAVHDSGSNLDQVGTTGGGGGGNAIAVAAYAGTNRGDMAEFDLTATTQEPLLWQHCKDGIVSMVAVRHHPSADVAICTGECAQLLKIVPRQQRQPNGDGRKRSVILWQSPKDLTSPEVLGVVHDQTVSSGSLLLWVGGADTKVCQTGRLTMWTVGMPELQEQNNEDSYSDDSVDTDGGTDTGNDNEPMRLPAVDIVVDEGSLFAMVRQDRRLAVAAGKSIVVWDCVYHQNSCGASTAVSCQHQKTLRTDNDLYTVTMNPNLLAAAGSGECILIWDMNLWFLTYNLMLWTVPKGCCLATNCIMSLDWGDESGRTLVCGGYDGCISLWTLAHRLTN